MPRIKPFRAVRPSPCCAGDVIIAHSDNKSAVAVTDEMLTTLKRLPIGYTKADSPTFIIDEEGNKLPNGEQGEIIVSGPAVT